MGHIKSRAIPALSLRAFVACKKGETYLINHIMPYCYTEICPEDLKETVNCSGRIPIFGWREELRPSRM
jgi:hypothetical protein